MTPKIPISDYNTLLTASRQNVTPNYAKELLSVILSGAVEKESPDNLVSDPINSRFRNGETDFIEAYKKASPMICAGNVACDIHYKADWSSRVRVSVPCSDPKTYNVCYGSEACICDNGYFKVSAAMPDTPVDYVGDQETLKEYAMLRFKRLDA